jgi:CBS domain containing-hemolysin-like protein
MLIAFLSMGLLMVLNGLFVAVEFALIAANRPAIERAAQGGSRLARGVLAVLRDPRKQASYIATAQLGITLASLGLGMYGEPKLADMLQAPLDRVGLGSVERAHAAAGVLALSCLTYLHILLGEIVPKTLALQHPERSVMLLSGPLRLIQRLLWPVVVAFERTGRFALQLFGVRRGDSVAPPSLAALRFMVEESVQEGKLDREAGDVIEDLLEFSELSAAEVMEARVRVVGLPAGATPDELRRLVRSASHSRYPVYEGTLDHIVGMVMIREVLRHLLEDTPLSAASIRAVPFVPGTAPLDVVLERMRSFETQLVVVMDEQGGTAGILTSENLFAEIVGRVTAGEVGREPVYEDSGELRALGIARIDEVGKQLGTELSHPRVDTVSGLVLSVLNAPPVVGDVATWQGIELRVRSVEGRAVKECAVRVLPTLERLDTPPS